MKDAPRSAPFAVPPSLSALTSRAVTSIRRLSTALLPPPPATAPSNTVCRLPTCRTDPTTLSWTTHLLNLLVPLAHARETPDRSTLDSFMTDLLSDPHPTPSDQKSPSPFLTVHPAANRIVALGDVHGDLSAMRLALRNSKLINASDHWIGGSTVLVQVGDQLDRGNRERDIYNLLFSLQDQAPRSGGAVHILLGNHELMNSRLDFRYVTPKGFLDFQRDGGVNTVFGKPFRSKLSQTHNKAIKLLPERMRPRARALVAGGPLAVELSQRARVCVVVGDNLFVHAGLAPHHLEPPRNGPVKLVKQHPNSHAIAVLEQLNLDTRKFLRGLAKYPALLHGGDSPVWMRDYSKRHLHSGSDACRMLNDTLKMLGVKRMIVGHTPQPEGVNSACGGRVWRIDTGMSAAYGGTPEAIEISKRGNVKVFTTEGVVQGSARFK